MAGMENKIVLTEKRVEEAFLRFSGVRPDVISPLPRSASDRSYFRLSHGDKTYIATHSPDEDETSAFIYLSSHFYSKNLPVPQVLYHEKSQGIYFQSDLGNTSLYDLIEENNSNRIPLCMKALDYLVQFQVKGAEGLDFSHCFPRHSFDAASVMWDLNYFKYCFLKPARIVFHEGRLEDDFRKLSAELTSDSCNYFLYRDFQSRNIMVNNENFYFIDFQGGRKGSLCYDPASFIYSARSPFTPDEKELLLNHYRNELEKNKIDTHSFDRNFDGYLLLRVLQAFGAYGYRGWFERKPGFSDILPRAIRNLNELMPRFGIIEKYPELKKVSEQISCYSGMLYKPVKESKLTVSIYSFSYKHSHPVDESGNGGGFEFDCRALPNPGKYDEFKHFSGRDENVVSFFKAQDEVNEFLLNTRQIVSQSVEKYISRGFTHLLVGFGCTGGQHRSVFCAEHMAAFLKKNYPVQVSLAHLREKEWERGSK
jgi:aminoglycoside/choline kinase family phosphotransferase